jgi:hypothetical protein
MKDPKDYPVFEEKDNDEDYVGEIIYDVRFPHDAPIVDRDGREYEFVGKFLSDNYFYQGLNMVSVIRSKSDSRLFGYFWWDDNSDHGESTYDSNGAEFGLECDYMADDFDWDNDYVSYYVFEPVEEYPITAYKRSNV